LLRLHRRRGVACALDRDPEPIEIELTRPDAQSIAGRLRLDDFWAERLSQLRDEVLQGGRRRPRRLLTPDRVDQTINRDNPPGLEQEQRQNCALLLAAQQEGTRLIGDLEWSEDSKVSHVTFPTRSSTPEWVPDSGSFMALTDG